MLDLPLFSFFAALRQGVDTAQSITFELERAKETSQEVKEAYQDLQEEEERAEASRPMDPNLIRSMGTNLEA